MAYKSDFSKVLSTIDKMSDNKGSRDDKKDEWYPERDKAGNAFATIRFLPERDGSVPLVRLFTHGFQGPTGKWFIENCPTTIGENCVCCSHNSELWSQNTEESKQIVRKQKRKLSYVSNILIIDDPKHPELNGTVKKFRYGKKIYEMIVDKIKPAFEDEKPFNPFCPHTGADFKLKIRKVEGFPNYDKSEFAAPAPLFDGDDEAIEAVLSQMHDLDEIVAKDQFKSAAELEKRFSATQSIQRAVASQPEEDEEEEFEQAAPTRKPPVTEKARPLPKMDFVADEDGDSADYFARLAQMD